MKEQILRELIEYIGHDYIPEQDSFLLMLIDDAIDDVVQEMFPFGFTNDEDEDIAKNVAMKRYKSKIRKIAQYHYDKQGKEGVTSYSESGVSVSYNSAGTPASYLRGIIPVAKIL